MVRLAVMGSGMIVRDFLPVARDVAGVELAAIVGRERSRPTVEGLAEQFGVGQVFTDFDACLADPGIDSVYVALPNLLHFENSRRALLAGKHVICEKPFTLRRDELAELRALAQERDLVLVEAITNQYLANYRAIRDSLPALGQVKLVQCEYSQLSSRYQAFREGKVLPAFDPAMGGGALMDIGIYTLHFVVGLLGRPNSIHYTATVERGVDTSGVLVLDFDGATAVCVCAKDSGGPIRTKIQGDAGTIVMDDPPNTCGPFTVQLNGTSPQRVDRTVHEHRMVEEFRAFQQMIDGLDLTQRDARLDHSELVLELAVEALASAGISLGS